MLERSSRIALTTLCALVGLSAGAFGQLNQEWVEFQNATATRLDPTATGISGSDTEVDFAWGDLNKDGWTDLIVVRKQVFTSPGKRTNVLLMNENGVLMNRTALYATATDVAGDQGFLTPTNDRDVFIADFNGDGWDDFVTATTISDSDPKHISHPRIYMNLGEDAQGNWLGFRFEAGRSPQITHPTSGLPKAPRFCSVAAGDLTGDGRPDLFFGDYDSAGGGTGGSQEPAGNDVNDRLWINDGNGFFSDESKFSTFGRMTDGMLLSAFAMAAFIGDINQDGVNDVVKDTALNPPQNVSAIYNNPSNPGFFNLHHVFHNDAPYHINLGDLNKDGRLDIVVSDDFADRYRFNTANDALGRVVWGPSLQYQFAAGGDLGFASNNLVADLNNDGWGDVLICDVDVDIPEPNAPNKHLLIFRNRTGTPGAFNISLKHERELSSTSMSSGWRGVKGIVGDDLRRMHDVAVFDLDNDGDQDMVFGNMAGMFVWTNKLDPIQPVCQTDIGHGGPGSATLTVCGGDLSTGKNATMTLTTSLPSKPAILFASLTSNPAYIFELNATLATLPLLFTVTVATGPDGKIVVPVPGGNGPVSLFTQWAVQDPAQSAGWAMSNAVRIDFKP